MITVEDRHPVALVRLDDGRVNAADVNLLNALTRTMREVVDAPAVVVTGARNVFSAGLDLSRLVQGGPSYVRELLPALDEAFLAVFDHPRPVVAAINGHAVAGGCVMAAACDLRLMSGGTIGLTELPVGVPFPITVLEIVRFATGVAAAELMLSGRTMAPEDALRVGLVHEVVTPEDLLDQAVRRATALGRLPAASYAMTKEQLHRPTRARITQERTTDDRRTLAMWTDPETLAGVAEYLERLARRRKA